MTFTCVDVGLKTVDNAINETDRIDCSAVPSCS